MPYARLLYTMFRHYVLSSSNHPEITQFYIYGMKMKMASGRDIWRLVVIHLLLMFAGDGDAKLIRRERAVGPLIAQFVIDKLLSIGLDLLLDQITETDYTPYLDDLMESLNIIEANFERALSSMEEIQELFTVSDALNIERKLDVHFKQLKTIAYALKALNESTSTTGRNTTEKQQILAKDIDDFKRDVKEIPDLLVQFHHLVMGKGISSSGRTSGLACQRVDYERRQPESVPSERYNINTTVQKIISYRKSLMELQVTSFQLRNTTCSSEDLKCLQESIQLEEHLQAQYRRFGECVPRYLEHLSLNDNLEDIHLINPTTMQALFSKQLTSIIIEETLDWDRIDTPQEQGLRCLEGNSTEVWSLLKAPGPGYHLKDKSDCFLSFDKPFINFEKTLPTFWTDSEKIDRKEFLLCLPSKTRDIANFLLYATSSEDNTTYHLKEVTTGKYLHVHEEKTSVHEEIDRRFVLVLLLNDRKSNPWFLVPEGTFSQPCDDTTVPSLPASESVDNTYIGIIVGSVVVAAVIGLIATGYFVFRKCRKTQLNKSIQRGTPGVFEI